MFLTKKAEQEFIKFVKQAKEALSGETNKFAKIVNLIKDNEINKAVEAVQKLNQVTELVPFYKSKEFNELTEEQRQQFRDSVDMANGVKQATEGVEEPKEEKEPKEEVVEEESASLEDVPGAGEESKGDAEADPFADLGDLANSEEFKAEGSMFEYLSKKASEVPSTEASIQTSPVTEPIQQVIKAAVNYGKGNGMADEDIIAMACSDAGMDPNNEEVRKAVTAELAAYKNQMFPETIENKTVRTASLIEAIHNYKEEPNKFDEILKIAKSCSTGAEFLQKCANTLDETPKGKQYPGKEMFNGDHTTFEGGETPKFPGQKVFMTREGGNAEVETIFKQTAKPEVDVYKDKNGRKKVTSISDKDGNTIAFLQPIPFDEPEKLAEGFDYNGIIGGEIQRTKPGVGEPKAVAAHTTKNYLDTINELADKKPESLSGKLPSAKASQNETLVKEAGFVFNAGLKKKSNEVLDPINSPSGTTLPNDATLNVAECNKEPGKTTLTEQELLEAKKRMEDREANITRSSDFKLNIKAEDASLYDVSVSLLNQLQQFPPAFNAVKKAAQDGDDVSFKEVLKRALTTNVRSTFPQLDTIIEDIPYGKIKAEYFGIQEPAPQVEEPKEEGKGKEKTEEAPKGEEAEGADDAGDALDALFKE